MKVPLSWLKEYVDLDVEPKALAERLTFAGLEVESLEVIGSDFKGIVTGEVLSIKPHPTADSPEHSALSQPAEPGNLLLCEVSNGKDVRRVVCGARNFSVGDKVPLAEVGALLPNGTTIEVAVIRGEASHGMLCAEDELGLSDDHSGLLILPPDTPAGTSLSKVLGPPETVLTLEVTPNRPDCLSLIGIAREVAALYGCRLKMPAASFQEEGPAIDTCTSVRVEDPEACPRYTARILSQVTIAPSPFLARRRLTLAGIRPINNIVDITNYIMLECGQPLHAFDQTLLNEGRIVVRRARSGERMATLDGAERTLAPELLVIADARQAVAAAGIMGGAASGILDTTRTVLLESACFKPAVVRKGSKQLSLSTESSYRFERGVDINLVDWASRRATALMTQWAGAKAAKGVIDVYPMEPKPRNITCRFDRVRQLLGVDIANDPIAAIFESLALPVVQRNGKSCTVQAPTFRPDLETEADLIEEIARMHGLDNIPARAPSHGGGVPADDRPTRAVMRCRSLLIGLGLSEIVNYSFVCEDLLNRIDTGAADRRIVLPRPISADHSILRPWLLPQMIDTLGRNRSRQIAEAAFFELGRIFLKNPAGALCEEEHLAVGLMGAVGRSGLEKRRPLREEDSFAWLKGILEALGAALSFPLHSPRQQDAVPGIALSPLPPGSAAPEGFPLHCFKDHCRMSIILNGENCGVLGLVTDEIRRDYRILEPVAVLEIRLAPLLRHAWETPSAERLPVYPAVTRDIALRVGKDIKHEVIIRTIWKMAPKELTDIRLFDIYKSVELGVGFKSVAYSLTYRSAERTLTDDAVNSLHECVKAGLRSELKAEIREG
ncbi:MAG: phenylalanine--tRNA ligase subunit beta [Verrucomicrobia bacterium]|nr:phenylalanine--tRNA ligase subunit beta [Verrucomicrobiota bacterium]MCG2679918.1 phenylalanine--tRNA ligase subunit beta [Kiritimatiellia bacterium]MBU4247262.1 phenylalanine--tRNA ligase subunit beta [Verrucomicrobiota bacterium]MBU4290543.1 phenylalanine--tRNA ligase subunit beta [Verrucomicrobiota bacterium]MBU4428503.1 phenylalanine--tRNA ligase subunit beta [Verrucomicrobiota bacterium]